MTVLERVADFVKAGRGNAYCDRCLSDALKLTTDHQNNQHANRKTNELGKKPFFERKMGTCALCKYERKVIRYTA